MTRKKTYLKVVPKVSRETTGANTTIIKVACISCGEEIYLKPDDILSAHCAQCLKYLSHYRAICAFEET